MINWISMVHYKLTYFNLRALGENIRFMFLASDTLFQDVRIPPEDWTSWKSKFRFSQVPVLEVNGKELTQSLSIARYLAPKFDQVCHDPFLNAKADEIVEFLTELRLDFRRWFLQEDIDEKMKQKDKLILETFPKYFSIVELLLKEIESGKPFITGTKPCWQDFFFANWVDIYEDVLLGEHYFEKYPGIMQIKKSVFQIPSIKKYLLERPKMMV